MERWQLIFLAIVLSGLLIGWLSNRPLVGLTFMWACMISIEVTHSMKSRRKARR